MSAPKVVIEYRRDPFQENFNKIETSVFGPFPNSAEALKFIDTYETEPVENSQHEITEKFTQDLKFKIVPMDHPRHALLTPPQT